MRRQPSSCEETLVRHGLALRNPYSTPTATRTRCRPTQVIQTSGVIINLASLFAPLPSTEQHGDLDRRIKYCLQFATVRALVVWLWCERPTHVVELGLGKRPGNDWPLGIFWFLFCSMFAFCRCRHSSLLKMSNREGTRTLTHGLAVHHTNQLV